MLIKQDKTFKFEAGTYCEPLYAREFFNFWSERTERSHAKHIIKSLPSRHFSIWWGSNIDHQKWKWTAWVLGTVRTENTTLWRIWTRACATLLPRTRFGVSCLFPLILINFASSVTIQVFKYSETRVLIHSLHSIVCLWKIFMSMVRYWFDANIEQDNIGIETEGL